MVAADSGNGVSATLDLERYIFINVDLTVHLHRLPQGEWVGLDAVTLPEPEGVGLADSVLHDERGPIGRGAADAARARAPASPRLTIARRPGPRRGDTLRVVGEVKIVLADDHAVVRSALRLLLDAEADLAVVAEAGDVDAAARELEVHSPRFSSSTCTCPMARA